MRRNMKMSEKVQLEFDETQQMQNDVFFFSFSSRCGVFSDHWWSIKFSWHSTEYLCQRLYRQVDRLIRSDCVQCSFFQSIQEQCFSNQFPELSLFCATGRFTHARSLLVMVTIILQYSRVSDTVSLLVFWTNDRSKQISPMSFRCRSSCCSK